MHAMHSVIHVHFDVSDVGPAAISSLREGLKALTARRATWKSRLFALDHPGGLRELDYSSGFFLANSRR